MLQTRPFYYKHSIQDEENDMETIQEIEELKSKAATYIFLAHLFKQEVTQQLVEQMNEHGLFTLLEENEYEIGSGKLKNRFRYYVHATVEDQFGCAFFSLQHKIIYKFRYQLTIILRIGNNIPFNYFSASWHYNLLES